MELRATQSKGFGEGFVSLVAEHGSVPVSGPLMAFLDRCMSSPDLRKSVKDSLPALLADIAHFLNISHGRHPGVVDHASSKIVDPEAREWLANAITAFTAERSFLNSLTVAAGPIRRHLDQDKIEALLTTQHRSFEMLATSDRKGCPAGAVMAFVIDWHATRPVLDRAAIMLGLEVQTNTLPPSAVTIRLANALAKSAAVERAMAFGSQQLLAQQRGLWHLIAARHHKMTTL
ncbi:MAG: hypothetical protein ABL928_12910 [Sphingorhabdus sp.]